MKTVNYSYLQNLNTIMDCPCGCRNTIADELLSINYKSLPAYLQIKHAYIVGKYFFYQSKSSNTVQNLEKSNESFDKAFIVAQSTKTEIKSPKLYFKMAHCKYVLAQNLENIEDAKCLIEKASSIVDKALQKFGNTNSSLIWLRDEIKSNTNF